ncbi:MAG TPA: tetratricopeptide repeat protein, partial [Bacteroidia bacterium]|nr:tetratricopeptide repeat protein [Bacteroidia bacterium]
MVLVSFLIFHTVSAQKRKKPSKDQSDLLGTAEYFFDDGQFLRALPNFQKLSATDSTNAYYHYKMGICYLHKSDEKELAITELERAAKINPSLADITLYIGQAYHLNNKFDQAIEIFNKYIGENPSPQKKKIASHYIEYCQNGKIFVQKPMDIEITNLGSPVNSVGSEYAPVISSDESTLIFTYKGERSKGGLMDDQFVPDPDGDYYEDIFISQRVGKDWLTPESISDKINTAGNDASIAVSADGQTLFIFKSTTKDNGDIFISTLKGSEWSEPVRLGPNINSNNSWEGSCSITSDGQMLYFASDRKGGFGGRDIYVSKRLPNGEWSPAKNLGATINTEYDEDAPFIHPDGIDLFFSSRGHSSMGGYDIMYSTKRGESWSEPINLGYPLNTTEDERYYVLTASGEFGYFSSDRKGSLGEQDIYTVNPGFAGERPVLALVVGTVNAENKPADAKIKVTNMTTGEPQGDYSSNSASGKFLIALTPGNEYKIAIEVEGMQTHMEYVNVKNIETFVQINQDVKLYTAGSPQAAKQAIADSTNTLQSKIDQQIAKYRQEQKYDVYEANTYRKVVTARGEELHDSVFYNVELGKYECPEEFKGDKLNEIGKVQKLASTDLKTTIFYIGPYKTLLEAELSRRKALKADSSLRAGIVVTVSDHGVRKTLQQFYATDYKRPDYIIPTDTKILKCKTDENIVKSTGPAGSGIRDSIATNTPKSTGTATPGTLLTPADAQMKDMVKDHGNFEVEGLSYKLELGVV